MPSAASVKVEKPPTTNNSANNAVVANIVVATQADNVDNSSPIRQISLIIEHKIRNLEKRKVRATFRIQSKTHRNYQVDTPSNAVLHFIFSFIILHRDYFSLVQVS